MSTAQSTSSLPNNIASTIYNPYVEMAQRVMQSALKMEKEATAIASLMTTRTLRPLTQSEQDHQARLHRRMDKIETSLLKCLNPIEASL